MQQQNKFPTPTLQIAPEPLLQPLHADQPKQNHQISTELKVPENQSAIQQISEEKKYDDLIQKQNNIMKIKYKKTKALIGLRQAEKKQIQLKKQIHDLKLKQSRSKVLEPSYYSPEQKVKVKEILKMKKIHELRQIAKHEHVLMAISQYSRQERQKQKSRIQKIKQEHRQKIQKTIGQIQSRHENRLQFMKQSQKRTQQLKNKTYIYRQKQLNDLSQSELIKMQQKKKLSQRKQRFQIDIKQLNEHSKSYNSILLQKSRQRKIRISSQVNHSSRKYPENMFSRILSEQDNQRKLAEYRKQTMAIESRQKINQFKRHIQLNFMPKKRNYSSTKSSSPKTEYSKKALSFVERTQKGNQYLKVAKKLRKPKDDPRILTEPQVTKHMDYLKTEHQKRNKKCKTMQKFKKIVSESSIDLFEANQAYSLMQQIDAKSKKCKDQRLLDSIQNKIDLLKALI